jgi:hypothetical protein
MRTQKPVRRKIGSDDGVFCSLSLAFYSFSASPGVLPTEQSCARCEGSPRIFTTASGLPCPSLTVSRTERIFPLLRSFYPTSGALSSRLFAHTMSSAWFDLLCVAAANFTEMTPPNHALQRSASARAPRERRGGTPRPTIPRTSHFLKITRSFSLGETPQKASRRAAIRRCFENSPALERWVTRR